MGCKLGLEGELVHGIMRRFSDTLANCIVKLRILRQLVELQLSHNQEVRETIDRAWGVVHNKHRKRDTLSAPPDPSDPRSMERLKTAPLGLDLSRKRYWAFDGACIRPALFLYLLLFVLALMTCTPSMFFTHIRLYP